MFICPENSRKKEKNRVGGMFPSQHTVLLYRDTVCVYRELIITERICFMLTLFGRVNEPERVKGVL